MAQNNDETDLFGGIALGIATLAALLIANSALGPQYNALTRRRKFALDQSGCRRVSSIGSMMV
jgi:hypothetical protein